MIDKYEEKDKGTNNNTPEENNTTKKDTNNNIPEENNTTNEETNNNVSDTEWNDNSSDSVWSYPESDEGPTRNDEVLNSNVSNQGEDNTVNEEQDTEGEENSDSSDTANANANAVSEDESEEDSAYEGSPEEQAQGDYPTSPRSEHGVGEAGEAALRDQNREQFNGFKADSKMHPVALNLTYRDPSSWGQGDKRLLNATKLPENSFDFEKDNVEKFRDPEEMEEIREGIIESSYDYNTELNGCKKSIEDSRERSRLNGFIPSPSPDDIDWDDPEKVREVYGQYRRENDKDYFKNPSIDPSDNERKTPSDNTHFYNQGTSNKNETSLNQPKVDSEAKEGDNNDNKRKFKEDESKENDLPSDNEKNKRVKLDNPEDNKKSSTVDYVLEKQATEPTDLYDLDGGDGT